MDKMVQRFGELGRILVFLERLQQGFLVWEREQMGSLESLGYLGYGCELKKGQKME